MASPLEFGAAAADGTRARVGFVGLGVMGLPMANNLVKAGFDVLAFDSAPEPCRAAAGAGHRVAAHLLEVIEQSDVVVTMLPDTPQVTEVIQGDGGILAAGRPGLVLIDMSSISPTATVEFARQLGNVGIRMIDAPVSGGQQGAISGKLSIMAGGDGDVLDRVDPVFGPLGTVTRMGPSGAGQATKVCNQVAVTLTIQAACEAFALGAKLGLDLDQLLAALRAGSCSSFILDNLAPLMLAGVDDPGFRIELQVKDLKLAREAAIETSTPLPGSASVLDLYLEAMANGQSGDGNQSLFRVYEKNSGAVIGKQPRAAA
jgi:2-hydroxy-3-oxopropionate reductase